jgi:hypothetical protein
MFSNNTVINPMDPVSLVEIAPNTNDIVKRKEGQIRDFPEDQDIIGSSDGKDIVKPKKEKKVPKNPDQNSKCKKKYHENKKNIGKIMKENIKKVFTILGEIEIQKKIDEIPETYISNKNESKIITPKKYKELFYDIIMIYYKIENNEKKRKKEKRILF